MTGTTRIPAAEISGFKGALIKRFARRHLGQVPSSLGVYWHNQQVLMSMASVGGKVKKWGVCDEQVKSFAHMAVAAQVGCSWCLDFNYFEAHNLNLDMDKAREIPRWRETALFSPLERQVLEYAEAMTVTPPLVTGEMVARLRDQLGDAALVELSAVIAFANFTTRPNVATGIESDGFAARLGQPLADVLRRPPAQQRPAHRGPGAGSSTSKPPATTSLAVLPKARPAERSNAVWLATSPETSTAYSKTGPLRLDEA